MVHGREVAPDRAGQQLALGHQVGDVALDRLGAELAVILAVEKQGAAHQRVELVDNPQHRALAAASIAGDGKQLARPHRQGHPGDRQGALAPQTAGS